MCELFEYNGVLEIYYETGMECINFILHDNRGLTSNKDYDPAKTEWPYNIIEFHSLDYALFFKGGEHIQIYKPDGAIEFEGVLTKDRSLMKKYNYEYGFVPKEIELDKWLKYFNKSLRAKAWSKIPPYAERIKND